MTFYCRACGQDTPLSMAVQGRVQVCKPCHARRKRLRHALAPELKKSAYRSAATWAANNKTHIQDYARFRRYRLTRADYDDMLAKQGGVCALCGLPPELGVELQVDHDHACCPDIRKQTWGCGKCVRGLLHPLCNRLEGQVTDQILEGLTRYRNLYPKAGSPC